MTGLSRQMISRLERGECDRRLFAAAATVADALGARLLVHLSWQGELLDRLVDAAHAELQNAVVDLLTAAGWVCAVEVSFNHYGDRGRYDILAFHPPTGIALVIEIKVGIGDVQDLLGRLDVKLRLAPLVGADLGWQVRKAVPMLVVAEDTTSRRVVRNHEGLFRRFSLRGRSVAPWLRRPTVDGTGLLLFRELSNAVVVGTARRKSA